MKTNRLLKVWGISLIGCLTFSCGNSATTSSGSTTSSATSSATTTDTSQTSTSGTTDGEHQAISNTVDTVSSSLSSDAGGVSSAQLSRDQNHAFSFAKLLNPINIAYAALGDGGCNDNDSNVTVTFSCSDALHTASITRDFSKGCDAGGGTTVTGIAYTDWSNMGPSSCTKSTGRPRFVKAVVGEGASAPAVQLLSTDVIPNHICGLPVAAITRTFSGGGKLNEIGCTSLTYTNLTTSGTVQSITETMNMDPAHPISRIRLKPDGTKLYDHSISTPTPMAITLSKDSTKTFPTRLISTGEVDLSHNLAKYTVKSVYSNVLYDYNVCPCHPVSGSVSITVTDNVTGTTKGTGTVTFTETTTGTCDSVNATYQGKVIALPLGSCHGI